MMTVVENASSKNNIDTNTITVKKITNIAIYWE